MRSKVFIEIRRIVKHLDLNSNGFRAIDIIVNTRTLKEGTIRTFIPKHARTSTVYFKRIGPVGSGVYKIRKEFL